jgi:hypothetical protein
MVMRLLPQVVTLLNILKELKRKNNSLLLRVTLALDIRHSSSSYLTCICVTTSDLPQNVEDIIW